MHRPMTYVEEKRRAEKAAYEARIQELEGRLKALQELYDLISDNNWPFEWIVATEERARRRDAEKHTIKLETQLEGMVPRAKLEARQTMLDLAMTDVERAQGQLAEARDEIARLKEAWSEEQDKVVSLDERCAFFEVRAESLKNELTEARLALAGLVRRSSLGR